MNKDLQFRYITMAKEITIAKLTNCSDPANSMTGYDAASFLQAVYEKLIELDSFTENKA